MRRTQHGIIFYSTWRVSLQPSYFLVGLLSTDFQEQVRIEILVETLALPRILLARVLVASVSSN